MDISKDYIEFKDMEKIYISSGWFNPFEATIKKQMIDYVKENFPNTEIFDPAETENSKKFAKNPHDLETAKAIYKDNIEAIESSSALIYPDNSQDLGTLSDLGVGIRCQRRIFSFNYILNKAKEFTPDKFDKIHQSYNMDNSSKDTLFIDSLESGIVIGYNYNHSKPLKYILANSYSDNIMLQYNFKRIIINKNNMMEEYKSSSIDEVSAVKDCPVNRNNISMIPGSKLIFVTNGIGSFLLDNPDQVLETSVS